MKRCSRCHALKIESEFYKASIRRDGLQSACKACANKSVDSSRKKDLDRYRQVQSNRQKTNQRLIRSWKETQGCLACGENFYACLELHHLDPAEKEAQPSELASVSFKSFLKEASKCVVLCANCHRKVHAGIFRVEVGLDHDDPWKVVNPGQRRVP